MKKLFLAVLSLVLLPGCTVSGGDAIPSQTPASIASPADLTSPIPASSPSLTSPDFIPVVAFGCAHPPADYLSWLNSDEAWQALGFGASNAEIGATVTMPDGDWTVMAADLHQSVVFAAPLPLTVGGPLVHLGGWSLKDGAWVWAVEESSPWREGLLTSAVTLETITFAHECLAEAIRGGQL